jgi:predicted dithiol-disulfide oxidoreductase (DUF899 family)
MCTYLLDAWDRNADDIAQRASLVVVARSPMERMAAVKRERGWKNLRLAGVLTDAFTRDHAASPDGGLDSGGAAVFTHRDGVIRHFWSQEMIASDPGQDPRCAPDPAPLWAVLDMTPEGRGADGYPSLRYSARSFAQAAGSGADLGPRDRPGRHPHSHSMVPGGLEVMS